MRLSKAKMQPVPHARCNTKQIFVNFCGAKAPISIPRQEGAHACGVTIEAAPPVAVFDRWAPRTSTRPSQPPFARTAEPGQRTAPVHGSRSTISFASPSKCHASRYFSNPFLLPRRLPNGYRLIVSRPASARTGITYQIPSPTIVTAIKSTCDGLYEI